MDIYNPGHHIINQVPPERLYYAIRSQSILNQTIPIHRSQYYIEKLLGKGYFGEVYSARRIPDGKPVAIKVISLAANFRQKSEQSRDSFLTEFEMSRRLSTTTNRVVRIDDFDFYPNGWSFFVMELAQHDLEKELRSRPPLSSAERKAMWRQLVHLAITLHNHRTVHLDIKRDNLLVFPGGMIKLADLGVAQKAHRIRSGATGTPPYSAPEVTMQPNWHRAMNSRKADIWSWGAILYRITYNQSPNPFYAPPCYNPPTNQPPAHDSHLRSILHHTLVRDPNRRPDAPWLAEHPYTKRL